MCWSAEVSAAFSVSNIALSSLLWVRNNKRDRWYVLAVSPIVIQEFCQIVLWNHIGQSQFSCGDTNRLFSLIVVLSVSSIPLTWTLFSIYGPEHVAHRFRIFEKPMIFTAVIYTLARFILIMNSYVSGPHIGTYVGPNHHQVWVDYLPYYNSDLVSQFMAFLYIGIPVLSGYLFIRPRWLGVMLISIAVLTLIPTRLMLPIEWRSVWCWLCCLYLLFAVVEGGVIKDRVPSR